MSSGFSGIDSPGTARCLLKSKLEHQLGRSVNMAPHVWAFDNDQDCQRELLCHPDAPQHLFGDVCDFWDPAVRDALAFLQKRGGRLSVHKLAPMVKSRKAIVLKAS